MIVTIRKSLPVAVLFAVFAGPSFADSHGANMEMMASGLILPEMNAQEGRELFAEFMDSPMNPFEFSARMWRGAEAMVELQRDELGEVIDLTGEELAAIIAFVHDAEEQAKFSEADIPEEIEAMMVHVEDKDADEEGHD